MRYRLGMVLSGGGTRGVAHIGVLKALSEEGVEPDCLSGTSAGAIVAALYAGGYSSDEMLEFFVAKHPYRLSRLSFVKPGFFDTDKIVADLQEYFPDDSFDALEKPVFLTATELLGARPEIFASGRLIPAILASASAPFVFAPTKIRGRWYADGGITNNFPVEPLIGHCDNILGVYASPLRAVEEKELQNSLAVSHRALEIGMYYSSKVKFHHCTLLLSPDELAGYGTFDTKRLPEIVDVGYRAARERMSEILEFASPAPGADEEPSPEE